MYKHLTCVAAGKLLYSSRIGLFKPHTNTHMLMLAIIVFV